jgi:hypothetical protein
MNVFYRIKTCLSNKAFTVPSDNKSLGDYYRQREYDRTCDVAWGKNIAKIYLRKIIFFELKLSVY